MARIAPIFLLLFCFACQFKAKEESGGLISGHQEVDDEFVVTAPSAGTRTEGQTLTFSLRHPYDVTVTNTPRLTLDIGGAVRYADYVSGSGTNTLTFAYVIQAGDEDSNGITATSSIDLNTTGTLSYTGTQGPANCATAITFPSMTSVRVDTTDPTVLAVAAPYSPATYYLGMQMVFVATMSENVVVTGTPRLTLTIGATTRYANYSSGSGTNTLVFTYNPVSADLDSDGIVVAAAIDPNSGTLRDAVLNDAALTFAAPNTTTVLVNGNTPYVTAITPPANGTYTVGQNLDFVFTYSELVNVTGIPTLSLTIGSTARLANYHSGSGSTQLTFRYTLQAGEVDTNGIASAALFGLTGATIRDVSPTNALNAFSMPSLTGVRVADNRPTVSSFSVNNGTYYIGNSFTFTALFSEAITVTGTPRIPLTFNTGATGYATYVSGSGTSSLIFTHTVLEGTDDNNGIVITTPIDLNSGTLKNAGGIDANLAFTQPSTASLRVSGIRPTITSVTPPANASYITGQNLDFVVNFSEVVTAGNTTNVKLNLTVGGTARQANYLSGSGTTALTFRYPIVLADTDTDGIAVGTMAVTSTGYITDGGATGNTATLTLTPPDTSGVLVNATVPSISSMTPPADGTYLLAQNIDFIANYTEAVTVTGSPRLTLTVGSSTVYATYSSGSGTTALTFRYTVTSPAVDTNGIACATTVDNNSGTIQSALGANALTAVPAQTLTAVLVDGDAPDVTGMTLPSSSVYDTSNVSFNFTVTFDQAVTVAGGTPRIVLDVSGVTRYANYVSGTGTSTLTFTHTINAADADLDGIALGNSNNLDLAGATIRDANSNDASLALGSRDLSGIKITFLGMIGWWDFDVPATITTATCGLQTCIAGVTDKSGSNYNLTQVTATAQPEYFTSGFGTGNRGYIQFDNSTDFLNLATLMPTIRTMIFTFKTEAAAMTAQDLFFSSAGGANARVQITAVGGLTYGGTAQAGWSRNGSALTANATTGAPALAANTTYILVVRFSANQTVATVQRLGNTNFGGQIAEVMSFSNNALTDAQLAPIINYLNTKHGVY